MTLAWAACGIFAVLDVIGLTLSRATFAPSNYYRTAVALAGLGAVYVMSVSVAWRSRRLGPEPSRLAHFVIQVAQGTQVLIRCAIFWIVLLFVSLTFMLLASTAGLPFQDSHLAALDQSLGFDWVAFLALTNSAPILSAVLVWAYHSAAPQLLALCLFLSFTNREERLAEFFSLLAVTWLATEILMALLPAAGAYAYYEPPKHLFDNFSSNAGMWHHQLLQYLRTEASPRLELSNVAGLITFPSFHTILAIITIYAVRGISYMFRPTLVLNLVVIVSTLPEGGHHLVDIVVGAAVAGAAILLVQRHRRTPCAYQFRRSDLAIRVTDDQTAETSGR